MSAAIDYNKRYNRRSLLARDAEKEITRLIIANEPEIARYLYRTWNAQADTLKYDTIEYFIRNGALPPEFVNNQARAYSKFVNENLIPKWEQAAKDGVANATDGIKAGFPRPFGVVIPADDIPMRNVTWFVRGRAQNMIVDITKGQIDAIQAIIRRYGIERGLNPIDVARYLRPTVGLTPRESIAASKYRERLFSNAMKNRTNPLTPKQIERLEKRAGAYSNRLHAARAKRIARTEMSWAYNRGNLATIQEYENMGWLEGLRLKKEWLTSLDEKTCPHCMGVNGQIVDIKDDFSTSLGSIYSPPLHPHCRCSVAPFAE